MEEIFVNIRMMNKTVMYLNKKDYKDIIDVIIIVQINYITNKDYVLKYVLENINSIIQHHICVK